MPLKKRPVENVWSGVDFPPLEVSGAMAPDPKSQEKDATELLIRIAPYHYVHVLNLNTNVTKVVLGPQCYICMQDEKIILGPEKMISVPAMKYCVVENPVMRDEDGNVVVDNYGQAKVKLGDTEIRFSQEPFPLYPGESLLNRIEELPVVSANQALHLKALTNFMDDDGSQRIAGDEWLFEGPGTYTPRKEVKIKHQIHAKMIEFNKALVLKAKRNCVDRNGIRRVYGEQWLVKTPGAYLPGVYEEVVEERTAYLLTDKMALHLKATKTFTDDFNKQRRMGEEWLVTNEDAESYILGVYEELVRQVEVTVLDAHQYCVISNPVDDDGIPQLGKKKVVRGEKCFFLRPGEDYESGVQDSYILQMNEGLILRAESRFEDEIVVSVGGDDGNAAEQRRKVIRKPGDRWMLRGPLEYFPPAEVEVISRQTVIPLDLNEGIYVRNTQTGQVRAVIGEAYMLNQDEELWEKKLPQEVIQILTSSRDPLADRSQRDISSRKSELDLTRVVTYQVPHNAAVQIYDYREKKARIEFGPNLVMLGPDEQFTRLSLSGGKPKRPNMIKSLCLLLGPDFCTDVIVVETADHARLSLQLAYNWHFEVPRPCSPEDAAKLFSVPDFVGDVCKAIASRIRGTVASVQFDDFHKHSSRIIRAAVFGLDDQGKIQDKFIFPQNNLCITSIDVQSVEPVDQRTRDSLQKSVQLAIEITTNSQEAAARHEAERVEQEAKGRLERQRIEDETSAEKVRQTLIETRVQLAALESTGQATAEARGQAESARIEGEAAVEQSRLRAEAMKIETDAELERLKKARAAELEYISEKDELALKLKDEEAKIEISRFNAMVTTIGPQTLQAIATSGPEHNIRMLSALGLQSTLITDGTTPINLLTTAHGLIGSTFNPNRKRRANNAFDQVGSDAAEQARTEDADSEMS